MGMEVLAVQSTSATSILTERIKVNQTLSIPPKMGMEGIEPPNTGNSAHYSSAGASQFTTSLHTLFVLRSEEHHNHQMRMPTTREDKITDFLSLIRLLRVTL